MRCQLRLPGMMSLLWHHHGPDPMKVSWFQFSHHLLQSFCLICFQGFSFREIFNLGWMSNGFSLLLFFSMCMLYPGFELLLPTRRRRMPICLGNSQAQSLDPQARPSVAMVELGEGDDLRKLAFQQACIKEP